MKKRLAVLALLPSLAWAAERPKAGDAAPPFSLPGSNGKTVTLSEFSGKKTVVLAFFPKAFTGGCTREMSGFRDKLAEFTGSDAQVLGVSMDDLDTQKKFAESLKLPFPLLADPAGKAATDYGVKGENYANRVTFVIGKDGKVVEVMEGKDAVDPTGALSACTKPKP